MRRYAYFVILGLGVVAIWLWQSESGQDVARDNLSPSTADSPESEPEAQRPLTPEERSAYIAAVNRALREGLVVYKGRLRLEGRFGRVEYVPVPLISVGCGGLFDDVEVRAPGGGGEGGFGDEYLSPASMSLTNLFSTDIDRALHETVMETSDGAEVLDEVCRMVIDELERLSAEPPG